MPDVTASGTEMMIPRQLIYWLLGRHCRPKDFGGLGGLTLEIQNNALILKQFHKFFSRSDLPWVQLVWSLSDLALPPQA